MIDKGGLGDVVGDDQGREKTVGPGRPLPFDVRRYDVGATAAANTLTLAPQDCKATTPPRTASFTATKPNAEGKRALALRLPYRKPGTRVTSFAVYRYIER